MRKSVLAAIFLFAVAAAGITSHAQQFDAAIGFNTVTGTPASEANPPEHQPQTVGGGFYPSFSANVLAWGRLGVQGEVAWRWSQNLYGGFQPFRPILLDFNGIWVPEFGDKAAAELMAGFGFLTSRFYQPTFNCSSFGGCTNYVSSNHLLGHVGGGFRYYVTENVFVRPEAHLYFVRNNEEFAGPRANRFGISIGYSFRPGF